VGDARGIVAFNDDSEARDSVTRSMSLEGALVFAKACELGLEVLIERAAELACQHAPRRAPRRL